MTHPYPLLLEPVLHPRVWGGERLRAFLNLPRGAPGEAPAGEAWVAHEGNRILSGPLAGTTLAEATALWGEALSGSVPASRYGHKFPLLAKLIDARDRLSIQVHPDDAFAREREAHTGHLGKAEAWLILDAEPQATVIWGFNSELDREEIRELARSGGLERHLNRITVRAEDVIYNPPGTVHAIGAGIFLFEIQQASDLTYRLYDYGRLDASGRTRELHLDKALEVADLTTGVRGRVTPVAKAGGVTELVRSEHFVLESVVLNKTFTVRPSQDSVEIVTPIDSPVRLESEESGVSLPKGVAAVIPAAATAYSLHGSGTLLRSYVPRSP